MNRIVLFLKGITMGTADVIPGVSGGTLALILGVYTELVDTIKSLSPRIFLLAFLWLKNGRNADDLQKVRAEVERMNLPFLFTLGAGIGMAIVIGSMVIPGLMANYPIPMRSLFFGLITASVFVPFRMIEFPNTSMIAIVAFSALLGVLVGFGVTDPSMTYQASSTWTTVSMDETSSLKDISRRGPSGYSAEQIYWAPENQELRDAVQTANPTQAAELQEIHANADSDTSKSALKARSKPYEVLEVPPKTPVKMPQPALWFVFIAGLIAICAMILPGISGSYILLILGVYFFILNALKGFLTLLAHGELSSVHLSYVALFCLGCLIGILSFARVLSYALHRFGPQTLGFLVGLMLGCLRGIWPFQARVEGALQNVFPETLDTSVAVALASCIVGFAIVAVFTWIGRVKTEGAAIHG